MPACFLLKNNQQGTVGIYTIPLGSAVLGLAPEVQTITVEALAADTFTPLGYFFVVFEGHSSVPISPMVTNCSSLLAVFFFAFFAFRWFFVSLFVFVYFV